MRFVFYKQTKRVGLLATAMVLAVSSLFGLSSSAPANAAVGVATWTGAAGDRKFSTAENWLGDTLPVDGNMLTFTNAGGATHEQPLEVDITTEFGGLETTADGGNTYLSGTIKFQDDATWTERTGGYVGGDYSVDVAGDFTINPTGYFTASVLTASGTVTVKGNTVLTSPPLAGIGALVVENGWVCYGVGTSSTVTYPVTLGGGSGDSTPVLRAGFCGMGVGGSLPSLTLTFNHVTLQGDARASVGNPQVIDIKELVSNGHSISLYDGSDGELKTPQGVQAPQEKTTKLDGDKPEEYATVINKETAILNGTRSSISVNKGGTLRGSGTVGYLSVTGVVAPGNSPGQITVQNYLSFYGGEYQAEILNKDSYDKIIVQAGGTVDIQAGSTLNTILLPGASVVEGDVYTIIDNQSSNGVQGTFEGLAEGATFTANGATFRISYAGGDGNDITLTALNTVSVPNTGFTLAQQNPGVVLVGIVAVLGALFIANKARKLSRR